MSDTMTAALLDSVALHAVDAWEDRLSEATEERKLPDDCRPHHHARVPYPALWERITDPDGDIGTRVLFAAMLRANENGYAEFKRGELVSWITVRKAGKVVPAEGRRVSRAIAAHVRAGTFGRMSDRQTISLGGLAMNGARKGT